MKQQPRARGPEAPHGPRQGPPVPTWAPGPTGPGPGPWTRPGRTQGRARAVATGGGGTPQAGL